jgi:hypothetical protein
MGVLGKYFLCVQPCVYRATYKDKECFIYLFVHLFIYLWYCGLNSRASHLLGRYSTT